MNKKDFFLIGSGNKWKVHYAGNPEPEPLYLATIDGDQRVIRKGKDCTEKHLKAVKKFSRKIAQTKI